MALKNDHKGILCPKINAKKIYHQSKICLTHQKKIMETSSNFSTLIIVGYVIANIVLLHCILYYQRSVRRRYSKDLWKQHRRRVSI